MNNQNQMTWGNFKSTLQKNPDLHLQFRYAGENLVKPSYHITEIKQAPIVSVDCGGNPDAIVKIEFGNTAFKTRQLYPQQFEVGGEDLIINLSPDFTQCKALSRGDTCGPKPDSVKPAANSVPKIEMYNAEGEGSSCAPGSGCC
ncbi:DUF6428 family protein [Pedobacter antarcticus]|uniref:DUF6428 family protein n=1 Tax=Pedobacter antarcticus TaxID=34086 RepID=UPI00088FC6AF|nr:DUF6428 family protein [Pedobacter antarcticus]SDM20925.1 hypothetical protein SAMN04488084_104304 [Pedobacter antarcticus]